MFLVWTCCTSVTYAIDKLEILSQVNERIERHRKQDAKLQLVLPDGSPIPAKTAVDIRLRRHAFGFGANLFAFGEHQGQPEASYRRRFFGCHELRDVAVLLE